ncbi:MAG: YggS family pyridoxal phosphate-dependent enzyme, partial [Cyanobacteria bacterium J06598_3]
RDFAENKVQEALAKQAELGDLTDVTWHFIGHIQSNKSRKIVENFEVIHSVDSIKLANRLDRQAAELGKRPTCYLQVKLASDPTKDGFEVAELRSVLEALDNLTHLNIVGLMVIPPNGLDPDQIQAIFNQGKALAAELQQQTWRHLDFQALSMGMSGDFELAIAAGSTAVRIGSRLFGRRS